MVLSKNPDGKLSEKNTNIFNSFPNNPWFLHIYITSLLKTLGKGEIACNKQLLLFPHCFLPFGETFRYFHLI